jgi:hypothetical protein
VANVEIVPLPLSREEAAWLAAVIDCEGWIGMSKSTRSNGVGYWAVVGVGNTNVKLIDRLFALTGIGVVNLSTRANIKNSKPCHMWTVTRYEHVRALLMAIRPFLILKDAQADLILSLPPKHAKANEEKARVKAQLSVLNKKGRAA